MIEKTILSALINNHEYVRKVIPYIDRDYFQEMGEKIVFSLIKEHFVKYNTIPNKTVIGVELDNKKINEDFHKQAASVLSSLNNEPVDTKWLIDATEDFCKRRAFLNAMITASGFLDKDDTTLYHGALDVVSKALSVSFDSDLGSDYFEDAEERYELTKKGFDKIACTLDIFNRVTRGGFVYPSLTIFMAPTGVGKSLALANFAASFLQLGKNVLYITMEMSEKQVEQRIDLNLLDLREDQIKLLEKHQYMNRVGALKKKFTGKLRTKEYPARSAHSGHFRYFIDELKLKENFVPDVIIVDYLNICASSTAPKNIPTHQYAGRVAVELRAIGQEYRVPVFSATQTNRDGTKTSDFEITDVAESWEVMHHADYVYGLIETEELAKMNQMKVKRLKDRYQAVTDGGSFTIGVDKTKQKFFDINYESEADKEEIDEDFKELLG